MNSRRKRAARRIIFGVGLLVVAWILYWYGSRTPKIASFAECAGAGYPVMESYPRQCRTPDGETFREDIGNELEKDDLIRIESPRPNSVISSPLTVKGMARGSWFFEASFPVRLFDGRGEMLARGIATAQGDPASGRVNWMTAEFVPFEATLTFTQSAAEFGTLLLDKDNPSGLPENDPEGEQAPYGAGDALRVPVRFK